VHFEDRSVFIFLIVAHPTETVFNKTIAREKTTALPALPTLQTVEANVYRQGCAAVGAGRWVVAACLVFQ